MHTFEDIQRRVRQTVKEQLGLDVEPPDTGFLGTMSTIDPHSPPQGDDDLGADSLDAIEIVMAIEDEFGIQIPDEEGEKLLTVADLTRHVATTLKVEVPA